MKTKEIEVWVPTMVTDSFARSEIFTIKTRDMIEGSWLKARLIIEIPEKTITISESEFWEIVKSLKNEYGGISGPDVLAEKLFSKDGQRE